MTDGSGVSPGAKIPEMCSSQFMLASKAGETRPSAFLENISARAANSAFCGNCSARPVEYGNWSVLCIRHQFVRFFLQKLRVLAPGVSSDAMHLATVPMTACL